MWSVCNFAVFHRNAHNMCLLAWTLQYIRSSRTLTSTSTRLHPYIEAAPTHHGCEKGVWQERWVDGRGIQPSFSLHPHLYTVPHLPFCFAHTRNIPFPYCGSSGTDFSRRPRTSPFQLAPQNRDHIRWMCTIEGSGVKGEISSLPATSLSTILNPQQWWKLK